MAGTIGVRKIGLRFFNGWLGGLLGVALALAVTQPSAESQEKAAKLPQSQLNQFESAAFLANSSELSGPRHVWGNDMLERALGVSDASEQMLVHSSLPHLSRSASLTQLEHFPLSHAGDRSHHRPIHLLSLFEMPQSEPELYVPERLDTQALVLKPLFTQWSATEGAVDNALGNL